MNNFADEEFQEEQDVRSEDRRDDVVEETPAEEKRGWAAFLKHKWVRMPLRVGTGVIILGGCVAIYWSLRPPVFDVVEQARAKAVEHSHFEPEQPLPTGYVTAATVINLGELLLEKPGGYMANDRIAVTRFVDNIRNWEYGFVLQMRDTVYALRQEFSRSRSQSLERKELIEAEARFNFDHNSWVLPKTEAKYSEGLDYIREYLNNLSTVQSGAQIFVARQDVLDSYISRQQKRLGSFTVRLRKNIAGYQYDPFMLTSGEEEDETKDQLNSWTERDDEFYEIRGSVYVMYHVLLALRSDYTEVLNDSNAYGTMNRILSELYMANQPMRSPMVLNGEEFGFLQNHSLTLAAHLAKANLAMQDLRTLLRGGSDI